jgi:hypothetical protein
LLRLGDFFTPARSTRGVDAQLAILGYDDVAYFNIGKPVPRPWIG